MTNLFFDEEATSSATVERVGTTRSPFPEAHTEADWQELVTNRDPFSGLDDDKKPLFPANNSEIVATKEKNKKNLKMPLSGRV